MPVEAWSAREFDASLRARERVLVLYDALWCPHAAIVRARFEASEPESPVPFARALLARQRDARRAAYGIRRVPTLAYYEHGEELERVEGLPRLGLSARDLDEMLALIESIQEEPVLPKRMHGPRRT